MTTTNEAALRESIDPRNFSSNEDCERYIQSQIKTVSAPNSHTGLQLLAAEECPEEDPSMMDPQA